MSTALLQAFLSRLDTIPTSPKPPIAWPGVDFDPPDTGAWIECKLFPNEPNDPFWNGDSPRQALGFFQVSVVVRPGNGIIGAFDIAEDIKQLFIKATKVGPVTVLKAWQSPEIEEDSRISIPITIRYTGIVNQV